MFRIAHPFDLTPSIHITYLEFFAWRGVLMRPHPAAFGHGLIDLSQSATYARQKQVPLYILQRSDSVVAAYCRLLSPEVEIRRVPACLAPLVELLFWRLPWWWRRLPQLFRRYRLARAQEQHARKEHRQWEEDKARMEVVKADLEALREREQEVRKAIRPHERKLEKGAELKPDARKEHATLTAEREQLQARLEALEKEREPLYQRLREQKAAGRERSEEHGQAREALRREQAGYTRYFRRRLLEDPPTFALRPEDERLAREQMADRGIVADRPLAVVHARESGLMLGLGRERYESHMLLRNADITTYKPAFDFLEAEGYQLVRIGDPSMRPVEDKRVVDLALDPEKSQLLELWCLLRAAFFLGSESGPQAFPYLRKVPHILVGTCELYSNYGLRETDFQLPKPIRDRQTGRLLSPSDMLRRDYLEKLYDRERYDYYYNSEEQVLRAVEEVHAVIRGDFQPSEQQLALRREAGEQVQALLDLNRLRKWGPDGDFLGHGWLSSATFEAPDELRPVVE